MGRIEEVFRGLKSKGRKALIMYITAGDPNLSVSKEIIWELIEHGADMIELGVPFSDPTADGPVIQAASQRALKNRITLTDILGLVKEVRQVSQIPLILFGYYNPFFVLGAKEICRRAKDAGVDGLLIVDLPYEEVAEVKEYADTVDLDLIFLLAPTTDDNRASMISREARGFLYYISMTGVTGSQDSFDSLIGEKIDRVKALTNLPVVIGFGISTPEQAHEMGRFADGVVVGSALVRIIEKHQNSENLLRKVGEFTAQLRSAL